MESVVGITTNAFVLSVLDWNSYMHVTIAVVTRHGHSRRDVRPMMFRLQQQQQHVVARCAVYARQENKLCQHKSL